MSAVAPWWGWLCIGGFIGLVIVLVWAIAHAAKRGDEQPARGEAEAQLPDFDSHLEPLSIGVERKVLQSLAKSSEFRCGRVHRRERATLPARRGDR